MAVLKATKRSGSGTRDARELRKTGMTPCIIYGHGQENIAVAMNEHDLDLAIHHGQRLLEVDVEGKTENVLIKDTQYDTFGHALLHVDLTRVSLDERVVVTVPVVLRGTPEGVAAGGVLQQIASEVTVECVVTAIPDELRLQVNDLQIGETYTAGELELPEGASLVTDAETPICSLTVVAEEEEPVEVAEEEAAEPEVIGEKKEDQPEEPAE